MLKIYTLLWLPLPVLAILNGMIREFGYATRVNELTAHQISCLTAIILFGLYTYIVEKKWTLTVNKALVVGFIWLLLTILFEFGFGHYIMGHTWERLFHDYNILAGRLWPLVLLAVFFLPLFVHQLQKK